MVNIFKGNRFRKIYAQDAGIYSVQVATFRAMRMDLEGNSYYEVFGGRAGIMAMHHSGEGELQESLEAGEGVASADSIFKLLQEREQDIGIVMMKDEVVSQCQTTGSAAGLYTASA